MKATTILYASALLGGILIGVGIAPTVRATVSGVRSIDLTHHDALGHTQHAVATVNTLSYANLAPYTMYVDYTSPQLFCNGFGP